MQPYEVRQRADGSIDYNQYYARPLSLLTPAMRRVLSGKAALIAAGAITVLVSATLISASVSAPRVCRLPMTPEISGPTCELVHNR